MHQGLEHLIWGLVWQSLAHCSRHSTCAQGQAAGKGVGKGGRHGAVQRVGGKVVHTLVSLGGLAMP